MCPSCQSVCRSVGDAFASRPESNRSNLYCVYSGFVGDDHHGTTSCRDCHTSPLPPQGLSTVSETLPVPFEALKTSSEAPLCPSQLPLRPTQLPLTPSQLPLRPYQHPLKVRLKPSQFPQRLSQLPQTARHPPSSSYLYDFYRMMSAAF